MNKDNLQEIFCRYIEKFAFINSPGHDENYKWRIAKEYRALMDDALTKHGQEFAAALYKVKKCTDNIIDSYTQPFGGLCEFAKKEPETVRQMFLDLLGHDDTDIPAMENRIALFFNQSNALLDKYSPGSFRYKQDSHSVSAYLFLYNPDSHYMYKAKQSKDFADCIEFYDSWGSGDNINLSVYYKMCDWLVDQIKSSKELLNTDASRFELDKNGAMSPDENKHILAFDLIYCCTVYHLFSGIPYTPRTPVEKNLLLELQKKAEEALEDYNSKKAKKDCLDEAYATMNRELVPGVILYHKTYGTGEILSYNNENQRLKILFKNTGEVKTLSAPALILNGRISLENPETADTFDKIRPLLKVAGNIKSHYEQACDNLKQYEDYLE
ncbi:MAG: hypothetical protein LUD51_07740 [Clostridia bacterium]|nr:hypothetical protein [Clostridia bacterium]